MERKHELMLLLHPLRCVERKSLRARIIFSHSHASKQWLLLHSSILSDFFWKINVKFRGGFALPSMKGCIFHNRNYRLVYNGN